MHAPLFIDGQWIEAQATATVFNPASGEGIGTVSRADAALLDRSLEAARKGFAHWRNVPAHERAAIMRKGCDIIRERAQGIGRILSAEQGKPVAEAVGEVQTSVDNLEWMAEEATRAYGRLLVPRTPGIEQIVRKSPIGPVAAFTPWNFPALTPMRKIGGALAAGCSIILKPSEETPFTAVELVRAFADAGVPAGVINLVFGDSRLISGHLIDSPIIRKITFTGSTAVGKILQARAAQGVKRATMELGGHGPVIVCDDVDVDSAARLAAKSKFRNAGQVCTSPTRFFVQKGVYEPFVEAFTAATKALRIGEGTEDKVDMGPLANERQLKAAESFVADAVAAGARLTTGGKRIGNRGFFHEPTVLADVPDSARIMTEEPFGPVVPFQSFDTLDEALCKANSLPYALAGYVMTRSLSRSARLSEEIEAGMVVVNHFSVSTPYSPFGGMKESGDGLEGGIEGLDAYLVSKTVTTRVAGGDLD
ncbi:NAD-dependent succinate-semialdehyde dehydrogenase [Aureimonas fodinaquatilis]|nr:NAD-dependent succinate-semialdehyde dehydrogenase [Aureimonas fodinaquatilis]